MLDYLHECLARHGAVAFALFGRQQDLEEIERLLAHVVCSGRLTYEDIEVIKNSRFWLGGTFWQWPSREEFDDRCRGIGDDTGAVENLWIAREFPGAIVDRLLPVFRHIEPVSVVLRFIDPENFGIMSAPVEKILEIGSEHRPTERYLNYVGDLRRLQRRRNFDTAAEVDMALWTMSAVIEADRLGSQQLQDVVPESERWIAAFWDDRMLREIRVANLTRSLFDTMELAQIAEALLPGDGRQIARDQVRLAGRIAAIEFESAVMAVLRGQGKGGDGYEGLRQAVNVIEMPRERCTRWKRSVKIRNEVVHGDRFTRKDVEELIRTMREACDWAEELEN